MELFQSEWRSRRGSSFCNLCTASSLLQRLSLVLFPIWAFRASFVLLFAFAFQHFSETPKVKLATSHCNLTIITVAHKYISRNTV